MAKKRTKHIAVKNPKSKELFNFPNFHVSGGIQGMRERYNSTHPDQVLLIRSGSYIYNVSTCPELYNQAN